MWFEEVDKNLFRHPCGIAQSKVCSDLYITDKMDKDFESIGKVLALDNDYKVRYEYTGIDNGEPFYPCGLCTDHSGHVLITDIHNQRVHILDREGQFLQYVLTGEQGLGGLIV